MEVEGIKVIGHNLIRDPVTGAIINPNQEEYKTFTHKKLKDKMTEDKISHLESQVNELKELFKKYDALWNKCSMK